MDPRDVESASNLTSFTSELRTSARTLAEYHIFATVKDDVSHFGRRTRVGAKKRQKDEVLGAKDEPHFLLMSRALATASGPTTHRFGPQLSG